MNKYVRSALIVLVTISILGGVFYWLIFIFSDIDVEPLAKNEKLVFNNINEILYLRAMTWGVAGNSNMITISENPIDPESWASREESDYVFYTSELYYKKQGEDTLLVYVEASSIGKKPDSYSTKIKIIPIRLETYDESKAYSENYEKYGLKKFSAYEE